MGNSPSLHTTPEQRITMRQTEFLLLMVVVIWAVNYLIAKYGLRVLDPLIFNSIRYIVAALVLSVPFLSGMKWKKIERGDFVRLTNAGIIASIIYQVFFIVGLSMTTAGNAAVLLSTSPLWTIVLSARMHREKIAPVVWFGMIFSILGVVLIVIGSGKKFDIGTRELFGDLITLAAAALWGLNTTLQKPLLTRYAPMQLALILLLIGAIGLSLIAIPPMLTMPWASINWTYYFAAVISGAFSIGIANAIWSRGVQRLGPGRTSNFNNLVPVLALFFSYVGLREELHLLQCIGAGITVAGVWVARR